jgi:hypothetical protein
MPMNPMMRPPAKQGTSKMVPVVVSAGLAVGVFCGLLFGLGTAKSVAEPEKVSNGVKPHEDPTPVPDTTKPAVKPPPPKAGSNAGSAVPATGSNTGSAAPTTGGTVPATGNAAAAAPKPGKVVIDLAPEAAASKAKITIDDKPITGLTAEVPFEAGVTKKKMRVVVQAPGYDKFERDVEVEPGRPSSLYAELKSNKPAGDATATKDTGSKDTGSKDTGSKDTGSKDTGKSNNTGKTKTTGKGKGSGLIDI